MQSNLIVGTIFALLVIISVTALAMCRIASDMDRISEEMYKEYLEHEDEQARKENAVDHISKH